MVQVRCGGRVVLRRCQPRIRSPIRVSCNECSRFSGWGTIPRVSPQSIVPGAIQVRRPLDRLGERRTTHAVFTCDVALWVGRLVWYK